MFKIGSITCSKDYFIIDPTIEINSSYGEGYVHCLPNGDTTDIAIVTSATGKVWMDRNLGASGVATSYNDAEAYGDLFQWGRFADGHQCRDSEKTSTKATTAVPNAGNVWDGKFIVEKSYPYDWLIPQNNNIWQGVDGINNPCPIGYRLPNEAEWEAERKSWGSNNRDGAFGSPLRLPVSGYRFQPAGNYSVVGSVGFCWSSSVSGSKALGLHFGSSYAGMLSNNRASGYSVRCIKD